MIETIELEKSMVSRKALGATRRQQGGFSLTEMLMWIVVVGLIAAALFGLSRVLRGKTDVNVEVQNLSMIVGSVQGLRNEGSYAGVTNAVLQRARAFGNMSGATTGQVRNGWGGNVTVTGTADTFSIVYAGVPEDRCDSFLQGASNTGSFSTLPTCSAGVNSLTFLGR